MNNVSRKNTILGTALVGAFLLTGCFEITDSSNVSANAVHQSYQVSYSEQGSELRTTASFAVGGAFGTTLKLVEPSRVSMNGAPLSLEQFLGAHYVGAWRGQAFSAQHTWTWIDQDGKGYTNAATIVPVTITSRPDRVSRNGTFEIHISGQPLGGDERLTFEISQQIGNSYSWKAIDAVIVGSNRVVGDLRPRAGSTEPTVQGGTATITLVRTRTTNIQQGTAEGGSISASYRPRPFGVQVVD